MRAERLSPAKPLTNPNLPRDIHTITSRAPRGYVPVRVRLVLPTNPNLHPNQP